jgi:hypothetical protein
MKTPILITLLLCSIGVMAQTYSIKTDSVSSGNWSAWSNNRSIIIDGWNSNQSDTVAVYMLVTNKQTDDYPVILSQIKGYSVTPRIAYNSLPFATYLDNNKKPVPDNYIVWMSVKR